MLWTYPLMLTMLLGLLDYFLCHPLFIAPCEVFRQLSKGVTHQEIPW